MNQDSPKPAVTSIRFGVEEVRSKPWYPDPLALVDSRIREMTRDTAKTREDDRRVNLTLERLPYCLGGSYSALYQVAMEIEGCLLSYADEFRQSNTTQIVFGGDRLFRIRHEIDSFLEVTCRAQDALACVIGLSQRKSVPSSMTDVAKQLRRRRITLNERITEEVLSYWEESGEVVRRYRDLSQHHAVVSSEGTIVRLEDGEPGLALFLPADPEIKSPAKWDYGELAVPAFPFCENAFVELFGAAYSVLYLIAQDLGGPEFYSSVITSRAPMGPVAPKAHRARLPNDINAEMMDLRVTLWQACEKEYGEILEA